MNEEREIEILKALIQQEKVSVNELAEKMYTFPTTFAFF